MKLKNLKHSAFLLILSLVAFGLASVGWAGPREPSPAKLERMAPKIEVQQPLQLKTDLKVKHIFTAQCLCYNDLLPLDAMLMKGIIVKIANQACVGGGKLSAPAGTVKLTYFNMTSGGLVTKTKAFSFPSGHGEMDVCVVPNNILVKKSTGIKAEVTLNSPGKDCNMSNNTKTTYQCEGPLIY